MEKKQRVSDVISKHQQSPTRSSGTAKPLERSPSDSSISSCRSSLSHGDGSEHSLHPSPSPYIYLPHDEFVTSVNLSANMSHPAPSEHRFFAGAAEVVGSGGIGGDEGVISSGTKPVKTPSMWTTARRTTIEDGVKKAALGFRVLGFLFCLISFSVMASDRNKGWTLDSFDRYIEFRFCLTVNVIGFLYSALQGLNLAYQLSSGKLVTGSHFRYLFDFAFDQVLAYLLISCSSSAATRVDDWKSNWGKDKFPHMASASVGLSFMAFVAFASSSIISGYVMFTL